MAEIVTGHLQGHALYDRICTFICAQGFYRADAVAFFAERNACFAAALDGEVVVGTSLNFSAEHSSYLKDTIEGFLADRGLLLGQCVTPACIYLDPAYRNQGLGDRMSVAKSKHSIEDGYTYTVLWGYETQAIFDYSTRIGHLIDTGTDDMNGFRIYLRKLEDVISTLS